MNATPGLTELLAGGFGALLGPGLALPLVVVFVAGITFGGARPRAGHLATAGVLVMIFAAASTTRGLAPSAQSAWLVSLSILLVLSWLVVRREEKGMPWLALVSGLLLATLAIQWRPDSYGPLLGSLRGSWQEAPDLGRTFVYHAATAIALGGVYLIGAEVGRTLPARIGIGMWWGFAVGAGALMWSGAWHELVRLLLLRWPYLPVG